MKQIRIANKVTGYGLDARVGFPIGSEIFLYIITPRLPLGLTSSFAIYTGGSVHVGKTHEERSWLFHV
jgi:hypothetical protein